MRTPRFAAIPFLTFAITLALSGCGSSQMGSSLTGGNSNSQSGTPPTVSAVAVQVNGVAPNRAQEVQFSEAMDPATINAQTFQVADSSGMAATGNVSYDPDFDTASFLPNPALQPGANYTATITTAVASAGGAHLASAYTYTFTTRTEPDTSPLSVSSVNPAANATCVSATTPITIDFNEAADSDTVTPGDFMVSGPSGTISTKIGMNVSTTEVVLTPASPLPSGTITVTVSNVADLAGVKMAAPYTWSFSIACGGGGGSNTFVYAGDSTNIAGFEIAADGSATAVPGSPFPMAGTALAASPGGSSLFGDFGGTSPGTGLAYYTYSVAANGSLSTESSTTQVASDPSGLNQPTNLGWLATDRTGASLYGEVTSASEAAWIAEYAVGTTGSLSPLGATPAAQSAMPISFTPNDLYGFFVQFRSGTIEPVVRNAEGTLSGNRNWPARPPDPAGLPALNSYLGNAVVSPAASYLAVVFEGGATSGVAVYPINSDGSAGTSTAYLPLTTTPDNGLWKLTWDSTGTYLFASSGGTIYEAMFNANANTVTLVGITTKEANPGGYGEVLAFLNGHLFALGQSSLYVYNFSNGMLTPAPGSPVPLGFNPGSIAALQH